MDRSKISSCLAERNFGSNELYVSSIDWSIDWITCRSTDFSVRRLSVSNEWKVPIEINQFLEDTFWVRQILTETSGPNDTLGTGEFLVVALQWLEISLSREQVEVHHSVTELNLARKECEEFEHFSNDNRIQCTSMEFNSNPLRPDNRNSGRCGFNTHVTILHQLRKTAIDTFFEYILRINSSDTFFEHLWCLLSSACIFDR